MSNLLPWNQLSLEEWRRAIGYHPYHFWQQANSSVPVTSACNAIVNQYGFQSAKFVGREEIREAIQRAEEVVLPWLGFYPAPHYAQATLPFPMYPKPDVTRLGYSGADDRWITIQLPEGQIQAIGLEATTLILAGQAVVYTDANGDGLPDTFTLTVPIPAGVIDSEIALYFNSTDRYTGEAISERWRVRPIKVRTSGANYIITGPSWLLVRPILLEGFSTATIDPSLPANFATTLDVYRLYTDASGVAETTAAAILWWETPPYPQINYNIAYTTTDPAGHAWAIARCEIHNAQNGVVGLGEAIYNSATAQWNAVQWWASLYKYKPPDRVIINYLAGYPRTKYGEVSHEYSTLISRLAAAELVAPICACEQANRELQKWQFDLARTAGGGDESYGMISREDLGNPFGTKRGQVDAWKFVKGRRILSAYAP